MTNRIMLDVRGRLRVKDQKGQDVDIVIQLAGKGFGNGRIVGDRQYLIRRHVQHPNDPRTPAQLARRERFRAGVAAWRALPEAERQRHHAEAKAEGRTGWNRFIADWLAMAEVDPAAGSLIKHS